MFTISKKLKFNQYILFSPMIKLNLLFGSHYPTICNTNNTNKKILFIIYNSIGIKQDFEKPQDRRTKSQPLVRSL